MLCAMLWYPLTLWPVRLVAMHCSAWTQVSDNIGHATLLSILQSWAKVLYGSPSRCFEEAIANHQHSPQGYTVREVDLMSAPQCRQHTRVVAVSRC